MQQRARTKADMRIQMNNENVTLYLILFELVVLRQGRVGANHTLRCVVCVQRAFV